MKLKEGRLSIFYNEGRTIHTELDFALRRLLVDFGYSWWASGCNLITGVRDIAFEKPTEREAGAIHGAS